MDFINDFGKSMIDVGNKINNYLEQKLSKQTMEAITDGIMKMNITTQTASAAKQTVSAGLKAFQKNNEIPEFKVNTDNIQKPTSSELKHVDMKLGR
jgi:hypothetical protein